MSVVSGRNKVSEKAEEGKKVKKKTKNKQQEYIF